MNAKKIWFWVGTLVVGALGSGLWSLIEAPFWKIANWFLTATTLGIQSIRDNVYARAALGLHELPSLYLFMMLSILMVLFKGGTSMAATGINGSTTAYMESNGKNYLRIS